MLHATRTLTLCIALILCACVRTHAHEDTHPEVRMSRSLVAAHHAFRSACSVDAACVLQNEVTEGPYYYDTQFIRENITEGKDGIPLTLKFSVVDTTTCNTIQNAAVDIWHCDANGVYSHYQNNQNNGGTTTTFLRGIQLTNSAGIATMHTILPGWYTGRTIHIHVKVHTGGSSVDNLYSGGSVLHTGQLFFNQSFMNSYRTQAPYSSVSSTPTALASDTIYSGAGDIAVVQVVYNNGADFSSGVTGSITLGVNPGSTTTTTATTATTSGGDVTSDSAPHTAHTTTTLSVCVFACVCVLLLSIM